MKFVTAIDVHESVDTSREKSLDSSPIAAMLSDLPVAGRCDEVTRATVDDSGVKVLFDAKLKSGSSSIETMLLWSQKKGAGKELNAQQEYTQLGLLRCDISSSSNIE